MQSTNITGGTDIITTQYSFAGQSLVSVLKQQKSGTSAQTSVVVTKNNYDSLWRIAKMEKKLSNDSVPGGMSSYVTVAECEYDAIGQLKRKKLGSTIDTLAYDYNIRGWLLGMNRHYAKDDHQNNFFGFDLGYDKTANGLINNQSYDTAQYNGNIAGTVWKSKGDGAKRKYDFTYDAVNRLRERPLHNTMVLLLI